MSESPLYQDRWITCEQSRLVIRGYYFPWGSKAIAYRDVRGVQEIALTAISGRWRIWGTSNPRYWFNLDPSRSHRQTALILDLGKMVKPVITPDDPQAVRAIVEERRGQ